MFNHTLKRRGLRAALATLLTGSLVVSVAGTAEALVADRPSASFPDFNDEVQAIVHKGNTIYVGGEFTSVTDASGAVTRRHVAAVDARTGQVLPWNPNVNGEVLDLAVRKEGVYIAGNFTQVRGRSRVDLALVNPTTGKPRRGFSHRTDGQVNAVTFSRRTVFLGGLFTRVDGKSRTNLAAVARGRSSKVRAWSPDARGGQVTDLARKGRGVYVGGSFGSLNGSTARKFLGRVSTRTGVLTRSFKPNPPRLVLDLQVTRTRVYSGIGGRRGGGALSVRRSDGDRIFFKRFDGDVEAITTMNRQVYVGGHFNNVCATSAQAPGSGDCLDPGAVQRRKGASLNTRGGITGWTPAFDSAPGVKTFDRYKSQDRLLAGGAFTRSGGVRAARFAVFN